jgi:hypothetical protein
MRLKIIVGAGFRPRLSLDNWRATHHQAQKAKQPPDDRCRLRSLLEVKKLI